MEEEWVIFPHSAKLSIHKKGFIHDSVNKFEGSGSNKGKEDQ